MKKRTAVLVLTAVLSLSVAGVRKKCRAETAGNGTGRRTGNRESKYRTRVFK